MTANGFGLGEGGDFTVPIAIGIDAENQNLMTLAVAGSAEH